MQDLPTNAEKSIWSTISSLKEIVTIVTGVTITNGIVVFLTDGDYTNIKDFKDLALQTIVLFLLLVGNIIRFYHGNMRHLDVTYLVKFEADSSGDINRPGRRNVAIDFFVIFAQSLIFAALSFYLGEPTEFFTIFAGLLILDVVWFLSVYQYTPDRKAFEHQKRWTLNNTIAVFALLTTTAVSRTLDPVLLFCLFALIIALNTIVDFVISWDFYFPSLPVKAPQSAGSGKNQDH
jgi:hypothetical protein